MEQLVLPIEVAVEPKVRRKRAIDDNVVQAKMNEDGSGVIYISRNLMKRLGSPDRVSVGINGSTPPLIGIERGVKRKVSDSGSLRVSVACTRELRKAFINGEMDALYEVESISRVEGIVLKRKATRLSTFDFNVK